MSDLDKAYTFRLDLYADKVEIYDSHNNDAAYMAIQEGKALELVDAILTEIERE